MTKTYLTRTHTARIDLKNGGDLVVRIMPDFNSMEADLKDGTLIYKLFKEDYGMFDLLFTTPPVTYPKSESAYLGRILYDQNGNWIYDGDILFVTEQVQLADFIFSDHDSPW